MQPELDFEFYIPAGRENFRVWEVANILRHSRKQIELLIAQGAFGTVVNCGTGEKSSEIITRAGLVKFLKDRKR